MWVATPLPPLERRKIELCQPMARGIGKTAQIIPVNCGRGSVDQRMKIYRLKAHQGSVNHESNPLFLVIHQGESRDRARFNT